MIAVRAMRTWQLTRRPADLLTVAGVAWLAISLAAQMTVPVHPARASTSGTCSSSRGVVALGVPAALDLRRGAASRPLVGDLGATELVAQEESFLGARVRALLVRLGEKDAATEGHTRRVAMLAVQVGEALGLPRRRLRLLALGGLLHDMGKLAVPSAVLHKPGPLDDDEFAEIRKHPRPASGCCASSAASRPACCGWCSTTTSGSTAPATRAAWPATSSTSRRASSRSATSTTRWSPTACTGGLDAASARSRCCATRTQFDQACVAALERLLAPPFVADVAAPAPAPLARARRLRAARSAQRPPLGGAPEHVRARVVPDRVEPALRVQPGAQVAVRDHDPLAVVERAGDHLAPRRLDDHRAAAAVDLLAVDLRREVVRERAARDELRDADHERARLDRDVAHRRLPAVRVVGGRRDPDLRPALVDRLARQRHPVLPADQPADAADRRRRHVEVAAAPEAVEHALLHRRHQLAVLVQQPRGRSAASRCRASPADPTRAR